MSVWIQVHRTTQLMDFFIEMASKRSDTAGHDVNDRMLNPMFLYVLAASLQCRNIIVNCLCRSNLRNIYFETMCIVEFKLMIIDSGHTIHFCFIHAAVTVSLTRHMIFNIFLVLVILCELINKSLVSAISA